jgi:hypothetical protein
MGVISRPRIRSSWLVPVTSMYLSALEEMEDEPIFTPVLNESSSSEPQLVPPDAQTPLGSPVTFVIGPLAGRTIRAKLRELQKADVGRKCVVSLPLPRLSCNGFKFVLWSYSPKTLNRFLKRDRRPLDPPPCCLLTLYDVLEPGTKQERVEEILDYECVFTYGLTLSSTQCIFPRDILPEGWICNVEMFTGTSSSEPTFPSSGATSVHGDDIMAPPTQNIPTFARVAPDCDLGNNFTTALAGSTFVQAIKSIVDGRRAILFLFPDLSCRFEGTFRLRYRVFNVMCIASGVEQRPAMASCVGGTFTVYNSRTFPGLDQPTVLTRASHFIHMWP